MRHMTGTDGFVSAVRGRTAEDAPSKDGSGWFAGDPAEYDREFAVDTLQLFLFLGIRSRRNGQSWASGTTAIPMAWCARRFSRGCKGRSRGAGRLRCCATASSTAR